MDQPQQDRPPISGLPQYPSSPWSGGGYPPQFADYGYGPGYGPAYGPGYGPAYAPPPPGTDGLAVASFVLGILGFFGVTAILSTVFGCIAVSRTKHTGRKGRGYAVGGLAFSGAWLVLLVVLVVVGVVMAPTPATRDASGTVTKSGSVALFALRTGDCFVDPQASGRSLSDVTAVPCRTAHNAEVFAVPPPGGTSSGAYPGTVPLQNQGQAICQKALDDYVYDQLSLPRAVRATVYVPQSEAWADGSRHLVCVLESSASLGRSLREDATTLNPDQARYLKAVSDFDRQVRLISDADASNDASRSLASWQTMAEDMAGIARREGDALSGTWPAAAQRRISALVARQGKAIPLYELAAKARTVEDVRTLLGDALGYVDSDDATAVRSSLGLSTTQGQAPNTGRDMIDV